MQSNLSLTITPPTTPAKNEAITTSLLKPSASMQSINDALTNSHGDDLKEFYTHLIDILHWRDVFACAGTVGANLTQNFYFLINNAEFFCAQENACSLSLSIVFCVVDFFASGTQNIYQRFWKSVMWSWISRLPTPTKIFVNALHEFMRQKIAEKNSTNQNKTIHIYMDDATYEKINAIVKASLFQSTFVNNERLNLEKSLKLLKAAYKVRDIQFYHHDLHAASTDEESKKDTVNNQTDTTQNDWHFNYNPENVSHLPKNISAEIPVISFERMRYELLHNETNHYTGYVFTQYLPEKIRLSRDNVSTLLANIFVSAFRFLFLRSMPLIIFVFQTVGMLADISNEKKPNLALDNIVCFFGMLFGYNKWKVNNAMRWDLANKNLFDLCRPTFYGECFRYLLLNVCHFLFSPIYLLSCSTQGVKDFFKQFGAASLRLFGILLGIHISLFYLYVALFTKHGIQFTLNTGMTDIGLDSHPVLKEYEELHTYIDIFCAIASLFFNGILTQMRESINKCDDLAIRFENWMDGKKSEPRTDDTPIMIHIANIIDIIVFGLSARGAIQGLLKMAIDNDQYPTLKATALVLIKHGYPEVAGSFCALSNLIFTYAASAPKQMHAWNRLSQHMFSRSSSLTTTVASNSPNSQATAPGSPLTRITDNQIGLDLEGNNSLVRTSLPFYGDSPMHRQSTEETLTNTSASTTTTATI